METIPRDEFFLRNRYDAFVKRYSATRPKTICVNWDGSATVKSR